jgi:hypothetical protein
LAIANFDKITALLAAAAIGRAFVGRGAHKLGHLLQAQRVLPPTQHADATAVAA